MQNILLYAFLAMYMIVKHTTVSDNSNFNEHN